MCEQGEGWRRNPTTCQCEPSVAISPDPCKQICREADFRLNPENCLCEPVGRDVTAAVKEAADAVAKDALSKLPTFGGGRRLIFSEVESETEARELRRGGGSRGGRSRGSRSRRSSRSSRSSRRSSYARYYSRSSYGSYGYYGYGGNYGTVIIGG